MDAAAMDERARVHARKIEQQDEQLTELRKRLARAAAEHRVQGQIIRGRNAALVSLAATTAWLLAAAAARPERVLDTGTPGVEVTR